MEQTKFFILVAILFLFSCKKESTVIENPYEGCCDSQPVVDSLNGAKFFIPNVFSPDNDGINDQLRFNCRERERLDRFEDFVILNRDLDTLFFQKEKILNLSDRPMWTYTDSVKAEGLVTYKFVLVASNGEKKNIESKACAINCDEESDRMKIIETVDFNGCVWGTQSNGEGGFDKNLSSLEGC